MTASVYCAPCGAQPVTLPQTEINGKLIHDPEWLSYRNARLAIEIFERYPHPKDLVRPLYRLRPKKPDSFDFTGLQFAIEDPENLVPLPHSAGWADLPLHPPIDAYKARFVANRPKGTLKLDYVVSIAVREDQRYDEAYLRRGCEQAFELYRTQSVVTQLLEAGKKCVGVDVLLLSDDAKVIQHDVDGSEIEVPAAQKPFEREARARWNGQWDTVEVRPPNRPHILRIVTE